MTDRSKSPKTSKSKSPRISFFPSAANKIRLASELYYTKPENEAVANLVNGESFKKTTSGAVNRILDRHASLLADACPLMGISEWSWLSQNLPVVSQPELLVHIDSRVTLIEFLSSKLDELLSGLSVAVDEMSPYREGGYATTISDMSSVKYQEGEPSSMLVDRTDKTLRVDDLLCVNPNNDLECFEQAVIRDLSLYWARAFEHFIDQASLSSDNDALVGELSSELDSIKAVFGAINFMRSGEASVAALLQVIQRYQTEAYKSDPMYDILYQKAKREYLSADGGGGASFDDNNDLPMNFSTWMVRGGGWLWSSNNWIAEVFNFIPIITRFMVPLNEKNYSSIGECSEDLPDGYDFDEDTGVRVCLFPYFGSSPTYDEFVSRKLRPGYEDHYESHYFIKNAMDYDLPLEDTVCMIARHDSVPWMAVVLFVKNGLLENFRFLTPDVSGQEWKHSITTTLTDREIIWPNDEGSEIYNEIFRNSGRVLHRHRSEDAVCGRIPSYGDLVDQTYADGTRIPINAMAQFISGMVNETNPVILARSDRIFNKRYGHYLKGAV